MKARKAHRQRSTGQGGGKARAHGMCVTALTGLEGMPKIHGSLSIDTVSA
jgi:hypothetical protein